MCFLMINPSSVWNTQILQLSCNHFCANSIIFKYSTFWKAGIQQQRGFMISSVIYQVMVNLRTQ